MKEGPILITMDTAPNEEGLRFLKTLKDNEWRYRLIGTDTDWVNFLYRTGLYLKELIRIQAQNPNQLCVVSDCRDVLCVRSPRSFETAFNEFGKDIVVSAEILCGGYPIRDPEANVNCEDTTPYWNANGYVDNIPHRRYVNAGLIAGRVGALIEMYKWMIDTGSSIRMSDDQVLMGKYLNVHPTKVAMDVEAELLHTSTFGASIGYMSYYQQYDSPTIAQLLGRGAFFLHLPGAGKNSGNGMIYRMVSTIIDARFTYRDFLDKMDQPNEWPWKFYKYDKNNETK